MVILHSYVNVYQRVSGYEPWNNMRADQQIKILQLKSWDLPRVTCQSAEKIMALNWSQQGCTLW